MNGRLNSLLARLLIGFGIPLVLFLAVALVAWFVTSDLLQALDWERHSNAVVIQALEQRQRLDRMHVAILKVPLGQRTTLPESYQVLRREFHQMGESLKDLVKDNDMQLQRLKAINGLEEQWHQLIQTAFPKGSAKPANSDLDVTQIFLEKSQPLHEKLAKEFNAFIDQENELLEHRRVQIVDQTRQSIIAIVVALVLALFLSVVVMVNAARAVTRPIQELREAAGVLVCGAIRVPHEDAQSIREVPPGQIAPQPKSLAGPRVAEPSEVLTGAHVCAGQQDGHRAAQSPGHTIQHAQE